MPFTETVHSIEPLSSDIISDGSMNNRNKQTSCFASDSADAVGFSYLSPNLHPIFVAVENL